MLVTGAARRVGRQIALALAERGCHVAFTYHTSAREARATAQAIRRKKVQALAIRVDQREPGQVHAAVRQVVRHFGGLHVLINNASSFPSAPWRRVTPEQWEDALHTNLTGPWHFMQEAARAMSRQAEGKIVNIVDVAVLSPWTRHLPYCAAKGGLWTLTLGFAKALAPNIQVNAIAPGPILFPPGISAQQKRKAIQKTLLKRKGEPEDLLNAVLFFLEGSDFVTGAVLPVDGGRLLA